MTQDYLKQKVNVVLAIQPEEVKRNIDENLMNIPNWFGDMFYPNSHEAYIVSAGPSMEKYVKQLNLKERMENPERTFVVFCVKHALPRLLDMGIQPDFCVILDGRPIEAESTHGINRKSLFKKIPDKTIFFVASMSNPSYAQHLLTNGARVLGWHTQVTGIKDFQDKGIIKEPVISGGTSSGTRAICLATAMGMRSITLVGFDSCIFNITEEQMQELDAKGRPKYISTNLPVLNPTSFTESVEKELMDSLYSNFKNRGFILNSSLSKSFITTGELLAQAQDFEHIFSNSTIDCHFRVLDDGLVNHMFNNMPNVPKRSYDFVTYLRNLCPRKNLSEVKKKEIILLKNKRKP